MKKDNKKKEKRKKEEIEHILKNALDIKQKNKKDFTCSAVMPDNTILEMVNNREKKETEFAVFSNGEIEYKKEFKVSSKKYLIPYPADNSLFTNRVVLLPGRAEKYEDEKELVLEIQRFIHKFLDLTPFFEKLASYYVLFTWIYDKFNELPYLRADGNFGSGKTRFLQAIGSLCYRPIFTSGLTTTAPIFRILNRFKGTLVLDEVDFGRRGMYSGFTTILNQGHAKGVPVLRCVGDNFEPKAFHVYGPKIVATRGPFRQKALESRFLVEKMGMRPLRKDIPINLPSYFWEEAEKLRNKLLFFRFQNYHKKIVLKKTFNKSIEPRLRQITQPLANIISDPSFEQELISFVKENNDQLVADQGLSIEADLLEIIAKAMFEIITKKEKHKIKLNEVKIGNVADSFNASLSRPDIEGRLRLSFYQDEFGKRLSPKAVGSIIRNKLLLKSKRTRHGYVVPVSEKSKILHLMERYGTAPDLLKAVKAIEKQNQEKTQPLNFSNHL